MLGHYHSFRHGLHKLADRVVHPLGHQSHHHHHHHHTHGGKEEVIEVVRTRRGGGGAPLTSSSLHTNTVAYKPGAASPYTVTIPCHHIRIGDILMLQGHPCQVIRISSSAATGQHRYLGVDLFTKQLHEESSQVHNPAPSVVVQTMRGPVLKQYRVLDLQDGQGEFFIFSPCSF